MATDQNTLVDQTTLPSHPPTSPPRAMSGFRSGIAGHELGLARVYAVDEQEAEGEAPYFPYDAVQAWAAAHGKTADSTR